MPGINFLIAVLFSILALITVALVICRSLRYNKRWKTMEPELIRDIEKSLGQKIECTTMLNANDSTDFSNAKGFWLWMAFTSDYIAFALRDALARQGGGEIYVSRRSDASMKRLEKKFTELEFTDAKSSERWKFIVCARPCDEELLKQFIPVRPTDAFKRK